jgi:calmodulin
MQSSSMPNGVILSEEQIKTAKSVFSSYDKRKQEKISINDLSAAFRALRLAITPDTLKDWADGLDEEGSGYISLEGFLEIYSRKLQDDADTRDLKEAFRVLDKDKKGEIDVDDLRWILRSLGDDLTEEDIEDMIRDTDTDGSGTVDFEEFYRLMTSE